MTTRSSTSYFTVVSMRPKDCDFLHMRWHATHQGQEYTSGGTDKVVTKKGHSRTIQGLGILERNPPLRRVF